MSDTELATLTTKQAERAQEAVGAVAHLLQGASVPAPEAHELLGELALMIVRTSDTLRSLGNGVRLSLTTHDVFEDDGSDPSRNTVLVQTLLQGAAEQCAGLADDLWRAQTAISGQGHRGRTVTADEVLF